MLKIKQFHMGPLSTNCYLVWDDDKIGYLFDIGGTDTERLETFLKTEQITLKYIILTHGHGDHIGGLNVFVKRHPEARVYIGKEDVKFLRNPELNMVHYMGGDIFTYDGDEPITLKDGDKVGVFEVIDSPGHSIGSKCFYSKDDKLLISGDTMFKNSYGRYDLPTGSGEDLFKSLKKLCDTLPDDTVVYNGHTEDTTIGEEKKFLKAIGILP